MMRLKWFKDHVTLSRGNYASRGGRQKYYLMNFKQGVLEARGEWMWFYCSYALFKSNYRIFLSLGGREEPPPSSSSSSPTSRKEFLPFHIFCIQSSLNPPEDYINTLNSGKYIYFVNPWIYQLTINLHRNICENCS